MSFKATVLPILNSSEQPLENGVLNNCSSIRIKKTTNSFPESIVNGKYFSEYLSKIEISSGNTSVKIQQVYPGKTIDGMFHFYYIVICDTANNPLKKIQYDEITEGGITITIDSNITEIKICCYYKDGYMICTRSSSPYYGYPKILYEEEGVSKVTDQVILRSDISNKFWICDNEAGEYAVDFKNWTIYLYNLIFDTNGNLTDEEEVTHALYTGKDFLLSSIDLFTNFDRVELQKNLLLLRNEHIIRLTDLEETEIYTTYKNQLRNGVCCFLMLVADYTTKNVPIVFWRRNSLGWFKKDYKYATDLKTKTLSSTEIPSKEGYNFDGYYINPRTENDENIKPSDESTLHNHSDYVKIVDSNGNFIKNVTNFSADNNACTYINIRPGKYAYANYIPKTTTITLKWNIQPVSGTIYDGIYVNGSILPISEPYTTKTITETYDKECFQLSSQGINIPTVTENTKNSTIKWNFAGFYSDESCTKEIINKEGIFLRSSEYTTNKKWKSGKSSLTLYAKWVKEGWIELDKTGNAPDGYYGANGSPSFSQVYGNPLPNNNKFYIPALYDEDTRIKDEDWNFGGYWTFDEKGDYKEQITSKGGGFRLNTEISNAIRQSKLKGSITIHAYWEGDKFKIGVKSSDKDLGSVSGAGKYKKGTTATLKAAVKDSNKYKFIGWKKEGKSTYESYTLTYSPTVTGNATYIADFGIKTYKIIYKDFGGGNCTAENKSQLTQSTSYWGETKIIDGVKNGYNFLGWYDSTGTTKYTEINEPVTKDITLYAKWEEISYTVTLSPGKGGSFPSSSYIKLSNIKYGDALTNLSTGALPSKEGYTFKGFYYDKFKYIDKDGKWIKNTGLVDSNGCSIIKSDITLTANYSKNVPFEDKLGLYFTNIIDIKAEKLNNVVFNKPIANKIATTKWINTTFGEPENNNYCDAQKDFYTQNNQNEYKSNKVVADKHFCYDFDFTDTKCLKQTTVQQMFNNSNKNKCNVYLRSITTDIQNNKTIFRMSFNNVGGIKYPITEQIPIYITINDKHIYKLLLDSLINTNSINKDYIDVELDNLVETIGKITIKHIPCFAIKNNDNTSETKYYMPYIVFYKYTDLTNLVIEKDTILENVEIKEYDSDTLKLEEKPSFPGGSIVG
jgi:uncharacterized repeat protein (TIGR02543 family)